MAENTQTVEPDNAWMDSTVQIGSHEYKLSELPEPPIETISVGAIPTPRTKYIELSKIIDPASINYPKMGTDLISWYNPDIHFADDSGINETLLHEALAKMVAKEPEQTRGPLLRSLKKGMNDISTFVVSNNQCERDEVLFTEIAMTRPSLAVGLELLINSRNEHETLLERTTANSNWQATVQYLAKHLDTTDPKHRSDIRAAYCNGILTTEAIYHIIISRKIENTKKLAEIDEGLALDYLHSNPFNVLIKDLAKEYYPENARTNLPRDTLEASFIDIYFLRKAFGALKVKDPLVVDSKQYKKLRPQTFTTLFPFVKKAIVDETRNMAFYDSAAKIDASLPRYTTAAFDAYIASLAKDLKLPKDFRPQNSVRETLPESFPKNASEFVKYRNQLSELDAQVIAAFNADEPCSIADLKKFVGAYKATIGNINSNKRINSFFETLTRHTRGKYIMMRHGRIRFKHDSSINTNFAHFFLSVKLSRAQALERISPEIAEQYLATSKLDENLKNSHFTFHDATIRDNDVYTALINSMKPEAKEKEKAPQNKPIPTSIPAVDYRPFAAVIDGFVGDILDIPTRLRIQEIVYSVSASDMPQQQVTEVVKSLSKSKIPSYLSTARRVMRRTQNHKAAIRVPVNYTMSTFVRALVETLVKGQEPTAEGMTKMYQNAAREVDCHHNIFTS
jgi:hypothetical protein